MPQLVQLKNGTALTIDDNPFANGGEGDLYHIIQPQIFKGQVVKIYFKEKQTKEREQKLEYLVRNAPPVTSQGEHNPLIWPIQVVYQNGKFIGFTMPVASGKELELICHSKFPQELGSEWNKLDFHTPGSLELRLKICFNIAVALAQVHSLGGYVLVDMKPSNIMIQPNGLISLIDIDSVAVVKNGKLLFPAPVTTLEYTPPEFHQPSSQEKRDISETWDRFSVAVIFYRLLCGIHPFAGTCKTPYEHCTGREEMILHGLFAHGNKRAFFEVIPPTHEVFKKLDDEIKGFFLRCFEQGHGFPLARPSAEEWCNLLSPLPVIQINRSLPSLTATYNVPYFTNRINFKPDFAIELPVVNLFEIPDITGVKAFTRLLFGNAKKTNLEKALKLQQDKMRRLIKERDCLQHELHSIVNKFNIQQNWLLQGESECFTSIKRFFASNLAKVDIEAKELMTREVQALHKAQIHLKTQLLKAENDLNALYESQVQTIEDQYQQRLTSLVKKLDSLKEQGEQEIEELENKLNNGLNSIKEQLEKNKSSHAQKIEYDLNQKLSSIFNIRREIESREQIEVSHIMESSQDTLIKEYLSRYKISDYAYIIFIDEHADHGAIVANLRRRGISSAADFTAVNESGDIKSTNGSWIKVSQVGPYRARLLGNWRARLERTMPANFSKVMSQDEKNRLLSDVRKKYAPDYKKLNEHEQVIRNEAKKKIAKLPDVMRDIINKASSNEELLRKHASTKRMEIRKYIESKNVHVEKNIKELQSEYNEKIAAARQKTVGDRSVLTKIKEEYKSDFELTKKRITKEYDGLHKSLLCRIDDWKNEVMLQFNEAKEVTLRSLNAELQTYSLQFDQYMQKLRVLIGNMHIEARELNGLQIEYRNVA